MELYERLQASKLSMSEEEYFTDVLGLDVNVEYAMRVLQKAHRASVLVGNKKKESQKLEEFSVIENAEEIKRVIGVRMKRLELEMDICFNCPESSAEFYTYKNLLKILACWDMEFGDENLENDFPHMQLVFKQILDDEAEREERCAAIISNNAKKEGK